MIEKSVLPNGLKFLFQKSPGASSVSIGLWVKIGSRYENDLERGFTHFLEHMVFKGTQSRTARQIAHEIEKVGGYINAATSREYTYFYITVMKSKLKLGLDILSDMIFHPLLKESDIRSESSVILEEMKSYEDDPEEFLHDFYYKKLMPGSSLGLEIIGNRESIQSAAEESIRKYYEKYYTPDRMILSIAGDCDHEEISDLCHHFFASYPIKNFDLPTISKSPKKMGKFLEKRKLEQVSFVIGTDGFRKNIMDNARMSLFNIILGSGMSSRLFQSIREEKGLCYSIGSYASSYHDSGIFTINCGTSIDKFQFCVESIYKELDLLLKEGVSEEELKDAKTNQMGSMSIGYELPENKMNDISIQEMYFEKYYSLQERMEIIESIKIEEINETIQKLYSKRKVHLSAIGNISRKDFSNLEFAF
ncbi:MAG: insulinase family protein [Leptospiraceae bacterium]|nr:insulinase family protein [Leptospiraceae bacterium]MCP5513238.1 insulinase family protein [Leptospiraceae bacterium]